jgi:hypothetical protein
MSDDDLLPLFDVPQPTADDSSIFAPPAPQHLTSQMPETEHAQEQHEQAVLTLGGEPVLVAVRPDALIADTASRPDLPPFEFSFSLQDEMAQRIERSYDNRRALEGMFDLTEACESAAAGPQTASALAPAGLPRSAADPPRRRPSVLDLLDRRPPRLREPFCWRRFLVSAAVSGGLGSAALLVLYWIAG